ncbi:MAG: RluA family pseudouridine synthase [Lachnospiraceae bacterium]|nr:RluA family pseudouridine synthase [Lachnospiraceae bacterium]
MILKTIDRSENGITLYKYLMKLMPKIPKGLLRKQLRNKNITLNGKKADGSEHLKAGDEIRLFLKDETFDSFRGINDTSDSIYDDIIVEGITAYDKIKGVQILYESDNFLFLNKPAGVLSQKADRATLSINEWLIGYLNTHDKISKDLLRIYRPSVMNRLDRNTSGIILTAKTLAGSIYLSELLRNRNLGKFYRTFLLGKVKEEKIYKAYITKESDTNTVTIVDTDQGDYDEIKTGVKPLQYHNDLYGFDCTDCEIELFTGKTHQIRAHMASLGHPILGDTKYGDKKVNQILQQYGIKYQLLHCARVSFPSANEGFPELDDLNIICEVPNSYVNLENKRLKRIGS